MIEINYSDLVTDELMKGAIINDEFPGFKEDYAVLHCLLRIHQPKSVFEIGTNMGLGTSIICNAVPEAKVYSLDLPAELTHISLKQGGDKVGKMCKFPFAQLRGDSLTFNYSDYPCDAAFVDGNHTEEFVRHETIQLLENGTDLIVFHDSDILDVHLGIVNGIYLGKSYNHSLYRVLGTRIAYLLRKEITTEEPAKPKTRRKKK